MHTIQNNIPRPLTLEKTNNTTHNGDTTLALPQLCLLIIYSALIGFINLKILLTYTITYNTTTFVKSTNKYLKLKSN